MTRATLCCTSALLLLALGACGDDAGPDVGHEDGPLSDVSDAKDSDTTPEVADTTLDTADILYPGFLCDEDQACSTGLCYGTATSQGFFEPAKCQARCLEAFDFLHYCDSDDDCCRGRCCIDCGPQEGLCVLP